MDLAQEVKRFLADEQVKAHRESKFAGVVRFRQHRRMAQMTCLSVTLAVWLDRLIHQVGLSHRENQCQYRFTPVGSEAHRPDRPHGDCRWTVLER